MSTDDEIRGHQVRCRAYLLDLHMLGRAETGLAPTAAEVGRATGAILAEVRAASRAAVTATAHEHRHPGIGPFLQVRLDRLAATAEEAIATAQDGDSAALRRVLQSFEVLTSAIWTVQDAVHPRAETRPLAVRQREDNGSWASQEAGGEERDQRAEECQPSARA